MPYNLLEEPLIRIRNREGGTEDRSLPEVLALLGGGSSLEGFAHLQPHQEPAWYVFLVQLAALACGDRPEDGLHGDASQWKERLRRLTPGFPQDAPWSLVMEDLALPAFMQPPVPEGGLKQFKGPLNAPDYGSLDLLVTAKHHDLKAGRVRDPGPDHWLFALLALQTCAGYSGKSYYGVARMNGGYGSRPVVGWAPSMDWGERFRRDLRILVREHDGLIRDLERGNGSELRRLLWIEPWNGESSLPLRSCDPYAVEISRRIRMVLKEERAVAYYKGTTQARLEPRSDLLKGSVGDPWIPVKADDPPQALTVSARGFHYDLCSRLLFRDGFAGGICTQLQEDDPPEMYFHASALTRGQGKTEGFHERWIRVPARVRRRLFFREEEQSLARLAKDRVQRTGDFWKKVVSWALRALLQGGADQLKAGGNHQRWKEPYDAAVDAAFFPKLWEDSELSAEDQARRWAEFLRDQGRGVLQRAEKEAPISDAVRERAVAKAWNLFENGLRRQLPELFNPNEEEIHEPIP